jgi:hypothetical protein
MSVSSGEELVSGSAQERQMSTSAQHQAARVSSEVAEVANRPKKRPGRRERSSITTRWQTMLVESRTIPNFYHRACRRDNRSIAQVSLHSAAQQKKRGASPALFVTSRER